MAKALYIQQKVERRKLQLASQAEQISMLAKSQIAEEARAEKERGRYPLHYIPNALIPAKIDTHPSNIILLTCDAFGVLPPVAKLTPAQARPSARSARPTGIECT